MSYASVSGHRSMALDMVRNEAYGAALRAAVGPTSVVLDLGAGTGVHGLMAARLGARRVYLVEPEDIVAVAQEIARSNGLNDVVRCLHGTIEEVCVPEPVDVIISVLTGNFLVTEDLLPSLFHARDTLLKPGGVLIPSAAAMLAAPVSAPGLHTKHVAGWSVPQQGVDLNPARPYAANSIVYDSDALRNAPFLADPLILHSSDFSSDRYGGLHSAVSYEITTSGMCHGWAGWCDMKLGDRWLSTSPHAAPIHWTTAFLPLDPPLAFERGERVSFTLDRAPHGDWTWRVQAGAGTQQHSTLFAAPMQLATLKKAALGYTPSLNAEGRAVLRVLSQCDGSATVEEIAESLTKSSPERYATPTDAIAFVQRVIKRHA